MLTYKNISLSAKTFYGVRFEPGEMKSVSGYINSPSMVRVFSLKKPSIEIEPTSSRRGRKKSTEPIKVEVAEICENTINTSEEETPDGN